MINVGILGCGQWGLNHLRTFSGITEARVLLCADPDPARLEAVRQAFPGTAVTADAGAVLGHPEISAVCVSTPSSTHYRLARQALERGKDVLCEKPLTLRAGECEELIALAEGSGKILMTGHVFLFNAGIRRLRGLLGTGDAGRVRYAHSERTNLGPVRTDVNALWDLAAHDVSIFNYLFDGSPEEVSARGRRCLSNDREDVVFMTLRYPGGILANIHVSWIDPRKTRTVTVVCEKRLLRWDDLSAEAPLRQYEAPHGPAPDTYASYGEFQALGRGREIAPEKFETWEPLRAQDEHFIQCAARREPPAFADGRNGLDVVRVLEAAQESLDRNGAPAAVRAGSPPAGGTLAKNITAPEKIRR